MLPTIDEIEEGTGFSANYMVVCYHDEDIVHIVAYESMPVDVDLEQLGIELEDECSQFPIEEIGYMIFTKEGYTDFLDEVEYVEITSTPQ